MKTGQEKLPLGAGKIIGRAFPLVFANFGPLLVVSTAHFAFLGLCGGMLLGEEILDVLGSRAGTALRALAQGPQIELRGAVFAFLVVLSYSFVFAAATRMLFRSEMGKLDTLRRALATGARHAFPLFVVSVIVVFLFVPILYGGVTALNAVHRSDNDNILAVIFGVFIALFYVHAGFMPAPAVVVVEKLSLSAIGRTWNLTSGYRWPIVGLVLIFALIFWTLTGAIWMARFLAEVQGEIGGVISILISLAGLTLTTGLMVAVVTLVYVRLREIKEGFFVEEVSEIFA